MSSLQEIEWEACLLEPRHDAEVERRVRRRFGRVSGGIAYFADCPWLAESIAALNAQLFVSVRVDHTLLDMAGLVVSHDNACRYCFATTRAFLRLLGHSEERIQTLEGELLGAEFGPQERAAFDFARRISRANPLPTAADVARLRAAGFDDLAVREIAGVVGLILFHNRLSTLAALPPQSYESLPDRWYVKLMRPLAARFIERMRRQGTETPLRPDQLDGPFSQVVRGLNGLPLAGELHDFLKTLWRSDVLPARSKALVFGVVAHGLGCAASTAEAKRLAIEGGMGESQVDEALAHLASPALDEVERVALPFARETIWYQPAAIQRRSRAVRDSLSRAQYVELLLTVSAANMICRLCPVLVPAP